MNFGSNNIASFESKLSTIFEAQDIEDAIRHLQKELNIYSESIKYKQLIEQINNFCEYNFGTLLKILAISI